ncbi:sigma-70 family RNA polymerase sigma factor [Streptomyces cellostaticus]|uniref:sigma-70 family RNA polymerase sigma factor n=1 Tax=Streptomyces cellostaticus TaxID=67285 RepID=UPI0020271A74|nr:sigma-70 family RNA polymerase sigma factor [Streptomyces cellostaticus]
MHTDSEHTRELVSAARAGDGRAREVLVADYLPLVYNIVGRALDGHADVDDVVQDTMFRALDGLGGLREPSRFRSWLVAIAMNQIRRRWTDRRQAADASLERLAEHPDPAGDFVDLTILRLGLSGQRREVAEATRWLDEDDRALLSLWWQEASGRLTRAELAEALGVSDRHAAVRVQRMKAQLETGRLVVRALAARPVCPGLADLTAEWDGVPSSVWRKRVARHARGCGACEGHRGGLVPAEGLLAGLALVVPVAGFASLPGAADTAAAAAMAAAGGPASGGPEAGWAPAGGPQDVVQTAGGPGGAGSGGGVLPDGGTAGGSLGGAGPVRDGVRWKAPAAAAAGGAVAGALAMALLGPGTAPPEPGPQKAPAVARSAPPAPSRAPSPPPSPSAVPSTHSASPTRSPSHAAARPSLARQVADLVNAHRAEAGCAPVRLDDRLTAAARAHARDMVDRGYFGHESPEGRHADARIAAAGYDAGAWAENLHQGPRDAATVVEEWMDGSIHEENMLGCQYRDMGLAAVPGPQGTVWVQTLAGPA